MRLGKGSLAVPFVWRCKGTGFSDYDQLFCEKIDGKSHFCWYKSIIVYAHTQKHGFFCVRTQFLGRSVWEWKKEVRGRRVWSVFLQDAEGVVGGLVGEGFTYIFIYNKGAIGGWNGGEEKKMRLKCKHFWEKAWVFRKIRVFLQLHDFAKHYKTQINNLNS